MSGLSQLPVGSLSTPSAAAVRALFGHLESRVVENHPGHHAGPERLVSHHNAFVDYVGNFLPFCGLLRPAVEFAIPATALNPGVWFVVVHDKGSSGARDPRPALLSDACRLQLQCYRRHCVALLGRLKRDGRAGPLAAATLRRLAQVTAGGSCPLLFHIRPRSFRPIDVGTATLTAAIPKELVLSGDAGRHFFLTAFHRLGLPDQLLDIAARHAEAGVENLSSTSTLSLHDAHRRLSDAQSTILRQVGIAPIAGLSRR